MASTPSTSFALPWVVSSDWLLAATLLQGLLARLRSGAGVVGARARHGYTEGCAGMTWGAADWIRVPGHLPLPEAADRYNLNYHQLCKLVQRGCVRCRRVGRKILVDAPSHEDRRPPPGCAWLKDALEEHPMPHQRALRLAQSGAIKARKRGNRWQVELASLGAYTPLKSPAPPPGWVTTEEAGHRLGLTLGAVRKRIAAGRLRARRRGRRWLVEEAFLEEALHPGWVTTRQAAAITGRRVDTICGWIREGAVCARREGNRCLIEEKSLQEGWRKQSLDGGQCGTRSQRARPPTEGWIWLVDFPQRVPLSRQQAYRLVWQGHVQAHKRRGRWEIDLASLEAVLKERRPRPGEYTVEQAARVLRISKRTMQARLRNGTLRGRKGGRWLTDLTRLEKDIDVPPGWVTVKEAQPQDGAERPGAAPADPAGRAARQED